VSEHLSQQSLAERLAENPDGVLERIAQDYGVSTRDVVAALPSRHQTMVAGELFGEVMSDLQTWGIVLECAGTIPPGNAGRGYYNMHGNSPIGGHIKFESCATIGFVSRPFMGRPSCSVQFFNRAGEAMFKVFVRRDTECNLLAEQVTKFEALRSRLRGGLPPQSDAAGAA